MNRPPRGRWFLFTGTAFRAVPYALCLLAAVLVHRYQRPLGLTRVSTIAVSVTPTPGLSVPLSRPLIPSSPLPLPALATNEPPAVAPESMPDSPDRVADARARRGAHLSMLFRAAGVAYPAREVYLRVFKYEGQIELWACSRPAPAAFRLVQTYPILCASGRLGPKRREGDGQVPEGFYLVDRFNPRSLFHLSLGLNYPNASDRLLTTDPEHPGTDIYIHGNALSVGCLAMGDTVAEELYLVASDAHKRSGSAPIVHIFPCRMSAENWRDILAPLCAGRPELEKLWRSLRSSYNSFEASRLPSAVQVNRDGIYQVD